MAHVSVFFAGGQSNAKEQWADALELALVNTGQFDTVNMVWAYHPGEKLDQWFTTTPQTNYTSDFYDGLGGGDLEAAIATIEGAGNTWSLEGIFWFQGEGDTGTTQAQDAYYDRFVAMLTQLQTDLSLAELPRVCLTVIDANQDPFYDTPSNLDNRTRADIEAVRTAQFNLAELDHIVGVDSRNYTRSDAWHLTISELERLAGVEVAAFIGVFPVSYQDLVADADFHDEWRCHDNAASTAVVSLSGTHNATLAGGDNTSAKRIAGPDAKFPYALQMNGSDDNISLGTLPQGASTNPFTLLLYVRPNTVNGTLRSLFERNGAVGGSMIYRSTGNTIVYGGSASDRWDFGTWTPTAGAWHKIALRYSGTAPNLRVNGTTYSPLTTGAPDIDLTGGATTIGGPSWDADIDIANIAYFERELTDPEVDAWFDRPMPSVSVAATLGSEWDGATLTWRAVQLSTVLATSSATLTTVGSAVRATGSLDLSAVAADNVTIQLINGSSNVAWAASFAWDGQSTLRQIGGVSGGGVVGSVTGTVLFSF